MQLGDNLRAVGKLELNGSALKESELRYRRLFETAKDGILILDADTGMIVDVNPYLVEMLGMPKDQFLQREVWELGSFKNVIANHERFLKLQREKYVRYDDLPLVTKSGRNVDVEFVSNVYLVDGERVIQCNIRDITERKRSERALRLSEFSVNNSSVPTFWVASDARILRVNRVACEQLGYTESELLAMLVTDLDPLFNIAQWPSCWKQWREQKRMHFESQHRRKDGRVFPVEIDLNWLEFDGQEYNFVFVRDITKRKGVEESLRHSDDRFRSLFEEAGIGIALVGCADGRISNCNRTLVELLGYSRDELCALTVKDLSIDAEYAEERVKWDDLVAGKTSRYQMEKRFRRKDGQVIWGLLTVSIVRGSGGEPLYLVGMVEDITERRRADAALASSELRYRTMLQGLEAGVIVHGADMRITAFNSKATELLGVTGAQMSTRAPFDAEWSRVGADGSPVMEEDLPYRRAFATREPVREFILGLDRPALGRRIWLLVNANPVLTDQKKIAEVIVTFMDVTVQVEAKGALRDSARFTEDVLNSIASRVVVLDGLGIIIAVNDAWRKLIMVDCGSGSDLLGSSYVEICQKYVVQGNAAAADQVAKGVCAVLGRESAVYELDYLGGGPVRTRWFRMRVSPLTGGRRGVVISHHDISEHKLAMEALRASKSRFEALFKQAAVGVAQVDACDGRFLQVNACFAEIVGRSQDELEDLTVADITHPQDVARDFEMIGSMRDGTIREYSHEKRYIRKDGSEVWVNVTVSAMWALGDSPDCVITIAQDISERKRLEEQFRQAQKLEAIGSLAGGIAHDFNNILTVITGYAELAQMRLQGAPEIAQCLTAVRQAARRATDLVQQILTFSRQQPLERRPIKLGPVVEEALKLLRASIPATIEFDLLISKETPTVLADATQIHQIVMNLGTNAWHAMKGRNGRMRVVLKRFLVDSRFPESEHPKPRPGVYARLSVEDTGCGMDNATILRIFEPFFTTRMGGEGTGIGLAVVHGIMVGHDGVITASSCPNVGTIFNLYFPACSGKADPPEANEGPTPRGNGERILVVDDEELVGSLGQEILTELGYVADFVTRPEAALALVRSDLQRYSAVITDQTMPGLTGLDLAIQLRKARPDLPIIITTGNSIAVPPDRVKEVGICELLLKPITVHTLAMAVHSAMEANTTGI